MRLGLIVARERLGETAEHRTNGNDVCRYFLWRFGETAAPAIQEIAETGAGGNFFAEVEACGDACSEGAAFMCNPFSGTCTASGTVMVTPDRPYISIASMVAPSPDWCALSSRCMPCMHADRCPFSLRRSDAWTIVSSRANSEWI